MSKSVALLSGKGGSGKTTLSLTIANMLSSCNLRVLLIDCDLQTNGATYFYEDRLSGNKSILSFHDILYKNKDEQASPISITTNYDFIPAIQRITENSIISYSYNEDTKTRFESFYNYLTEKYDVILFDCSAGYSDILRYVVPLADCNLVVLEADTISMAAMRSLYLKLGTILPDSKFYQIFNKIRQDEVETYGKKEGSFFTNIGAITFDWSIREAFSIATVPTIENTGIDFGIQLYNICSALFQGETYQTKLAKYNLLLSLNKAKAEQDQTRLNLINYRSSHRSFQNYKDVMLYTLIPLVFLCAITVILLYSDHFESTVTLPLLGVTTASLVITLFSYMERLNRDSKEKKITMSAYSDRLDSLKKKIEDLDQKIEEAEQSF